MFIDTVAGLVGIGAGAMALGFRLGRIGRAPAPPSEPEEEEEEPIAPPTCVGYEARYHDDNSKFQMFSDCEALRSTRCVDGRCRYHCQRHCGCEPGPETAVNLSEHVKDEK